MKLLLLGPPRTATTSFWECFKTHPNIECSKTKETFNYSVRRFIFPYSYLKEYNIKSKTKIIVDGTPSPYVFFKNKLPTIPIKIIYPFRNFYDRMYSTIKMHIIVNSKYKMHSKIDLLKKQKDIDQLIYDEKKMMDFILQNLDHFYIQKAFEVTDDVFITKLNNLNFKDIFDFLEIDNVDINFPKMNSFYEVWNNEFFKKKKETVDEFFLKNKKAIMDLSNEEENLLFNVR